jgi:hypothetical protein
MRFQRVRNQFHELRAEIAPEGPARRLIAVSNEAEADEVRSRLRPGDDALIVVTGVPRAVT